MKAVGVVRSAHTYPVKSLGGESQSEIFVDATGPRFDREFMIVNSEGVFITQRSHPKLSTLTCTVRDGKRIEIKSRADGMSFEYKPEAKPTRTVKIWQDQVSVFDVSQSANQYLSDFLEMNCSLVAASTTTPRKKIHKDTSTDYVTGFPDSAPFLIANTLSLESLRTDLEPRVTMDHFRPNLVVEFERPWQELEVHSIKISNIDFPVLYPCTRCKMINNNPVKGEMELDLLKRMFAKSKPEPVTFGIRAIHKKTGSIKVGDTVFA